MLISKNSKVLQVYKSEDVAVNTFGFSESIEWPWHRIILVLSLISKKGCLAHEEDIKLNDQSFQNLCDNGFEPQ